jgi:hypothetical protein
MKNLVDDFNWNFSSLLEPEEHEPEEHEPEDNNEVTNSLHTRD